MRITLALSARTAGGTASSRRFPVEIWRNPVSSAPAERATQAKRADARRNIAAILDAAQECLIADPDANITQIAERAGVGRVTLYGHFASRAELVDAVFTRVVVDSDRILDGVDLEGDPRAALRRLVAASWKIVDRYRSLLSAAQDHIPAERIRAAHDMPLRRVERLIERGRECGVFRDDFPVPWMVTVYYSVIHGAAEEIAAGRLTDAHATDLITATLLATYAAPE
ncbi:TetR/AcrR family transcriptional regulator [Nocardia cyriacigeorgica]|uniref:TetR/AcrR family transcriptional regulator n=1 Tax=Nocardia cyriacigeorgica TaxID=135487 RepID=UPI0018960A7B|nr:TetR/AcrR family transcriptional regulator [Nocardia cyriacigeorgica]MBF6345465.1 TetR/AcrR family transcriptional regulator [Nocardia cyriacigeorgica]MBF6514438.1 TetR/AcrR family transcriptional regulator [Nocardia cyriacigeorgica]